MNINRRNYESYFIDYIDGILTSSEIKELYAFLLLNDDLRELLECQGRVKLQAPNIKYSQKSILKKDEIHECPDYYAIATAENSLTMHDKEFLRKHPVPKEDTIAYKKIKLYADTRIQCPKKSQLYHHSKLYLTTIQRYISAAIVVLLVGIGYLFYPQQSERVEYPIVQTIVIPFNQMLTAKQIAISLTIKEYNVPLIITVTQERMELSIMELHNPLMIELSSLEPDYSLISQDEIMMSVKQHDMYLTEDAHTFKGDRVYFLSDSLINSMRNTGKAITQRLKIKYFTNNNSDDYALH